MSLCGRLGVFLALTGLTHLSSTEGMFSLRTLSTFICWWICGRTKCIQLTYMCTGSRQEIQQMWMESVKGLNHFCMLMGFFQYGLIYPVCFIPLKATFMIDLENMSFSPSQVHMKGISSIRNEHMNSHTAIAKSVCMFNRSDISFPKKGTLQ